MAAVVCRTELVRDPELVAKLDVVIARHEPRWMRLSEPKLAERIDIWVMRFDPAGTRVPLERNDDRYVEISPAQAGLAAVWAQLQATDGAALDHNLDAAADTVCADDPRAQELRRADALGAVVAGLDARSCMCGASACAASGRRAGHRGGDSRARRAGNGRW